MTARRATYLAWSALGLTALFSVVQAYYVVSSGTPLLDRTHDGLNSFPVITLGALIGGVVGALVASRHPGNPVGWLFCAGALGTGLGLAAEGYTTAVVQYGSPGPGWLAEPAAVLNYLFGAPWTMAVLAATFLVFPEGRLLSRRWRPVLWAVPVPLLVNAVVLVAFATHHRFTGQERSSDVGTWSVLVPLAVSWVLLALVMLCSAVALVLRLRRSRGIEHQQLLWLTTASLAVVAALVLALFAPDASPSHPDAWLMYVPIFLAFAGFQAAAGVAVLRFRLYEIEVVISRAVLVALLAVFATVGYVALVVTLGGLLGDRTATRYWPSVLATAVVALAFQPLRRRAVRLAHRAAYGERAAPYEALADLGRRLGGSPDPGTLLPSVAEASAVAVGAAAVTVRLHVPDAPDEVAAWPPDDVAPAGEITAEVHVMEHGEALGSIAVRTRRGHTMRESDRRLLADLADQCALAFRNARLTAELHARVAELDRSTAALARSRRRLVEARDAERQRLERAISRNVVPHLEGIPAQLDTLRAALSESLAAGTSPAGADLSPLVESTGVALDELRELTRGVFPTQLGRSGLAAALTGHLSRTGRGSLAVAPDLLGRRFAPRVEAAVYFCAVEGLALVPGPVDVTLSHDAGALGLRIAGAVARTVPPAVPPGPGDRGDALAPLRDRVESVGGTVTWSAGDGRPGLVVSAPVPDEAVTLADALPPTRRAAAPARTPTS